MDEGDASAANIIAGVDRGHGSSAPQKFSFAGVHTLAVALCLCLWHLAFGIWLLAASKPSAVGSGSTGMWRCPWAAT